MKLAKIKLFNYRCFGEEEQIIEIDDITTFIGNNSVGKTAALAALNCMFSDNNSDRILRRSDFHLPKDVAPEDMDRQEMYIETVFEFDELEEGEEGKETIPIFFDSMVVAKSGCLPYLRIRLEATWEKSSSIEGAIESEIYYITVPEEVKKIPEDKKKRANRREIDQIRVIYVPAVRDPSKQLRNASSSMIYQIMNSINWSETTKQVVQNKIDEVNAHFMKENGVSILSDAIEARWKVYDSDERYSNAQLRFSSADIDSAVKRSEVVFSPTVTGKEYTIDEMGDGLRSLFYISLVDSVLEVEIKIREELDKNPTNTSFDRRPPILTIIALEEPENHIAPHLIGKLIANLNSISKKTNAQTILTSHSPAIVRRIEPNKLRHFRLGWDDSATRVHRITLPDEEKVSEQYKYVKESVTAYPELYFAKLVILGEGDSEEILIPKFWKVLHGSVDESSLSIVPLGGRHVNHFWRLLNDLKIPYITLLDLDLERDGGGWGRIKYVLDQLLAIGYKEEDVLNDIGRDELEMMGDWDESATECMNKWINHLESYHIFFSSPLDIDFLMLEYYGEAYKNMLSSKEGPRYIDSTTGEKTQVLVRDAENNEITPDFQKRVDDGVRIALKDCGGDGDSYSEEQKKLMIWYSYFFLQRGKPSTHIELVSKLTNEQLKSAMPPVISRLIQDAHSLL